MKPGREALIVFLKNPEPGKVKTRLAAGIGDQGAMEVYRALIRLTLNTAEQSGADVFLWISGGIPEEASEWPGVKKEQQGQNLVDRMKNAFKELFNEGYSRICIIGSDCPQLRPVHIRNAFSSLELTDIVIGPARDGGYWLAGMNSDYTEIFSLQSWSHSGVFTQTLRKIRKLGLSYTQLEALSDLDEEVDYNVLKHHLEPFADSTLQ